jgi:hypothetical protein
MLFDGTTEVVILCYFMLFYVILCYVTFYLFISFYDLFVYD